jgi:CRISPR-associated protein (TIGR02584 family)
LKGVFRNILICLAGATPQIITETIYALSRMEPPVQIEELYIITTLHGKRLIEKTLIDEGVLEGLLREYDIPPIRFDQDSFILLRDAVGRPLEDIRNSEENEAAGDLITNFIREKTEDPSLRLHCSLAGGRKTMSFYMGAALQLFGRQQDRLYHVLVTPEFESNREFFYPPRRPVDIECRLADGTVKRLNTSLAEVQIAELPVIRLREKINLEGKSFREIIEDGQREIDIAYIQPQLRLNIRERHLTAGRYRVYLPAMQFAFYLLLIQRKLKHCRRPEKKYCMDCTDCYVPMPELMGREVLETLASWYERIHGGKPLKREEFLKRYEREGGVSDTVIRQNFSKIDRALRDQIDDASLVSLCRIDRVGRYDKRYGIRIERCRIALTSTS